MTDLREIQEEFKSKDATYVSSLCIWVHVSSLTNIGTQEEKQVWQGEVFIFRLVLSELSLECPNENVIEGKKIYMSAERFGLGIKI